MKCTPEAKPALRMLVSFGIEREKITIIAAVIEVKLTV